MQMLILKVKCLLSKTNSEQNQSVGCDKTKTQPTQIVLFSIMVLRVKSIQFRWESKGGSRYQNEFQLSLLAHWWEALGCIRMPGLSSLSGRMTLWIICTHSDYQYNEGGAWWGVRLGTVGSFLKQETTLIAK